MMGFWNRSMEESRLDAEIERLEEQKRIATKRLRVRELKRELGESAGEGRDGK